MMLEVFMQITPTQTTTALSIILFVLFVVAFVAAGAQVAFLSLTQDDINLIKTKQQPAYKRVVDIVEKPYELLLSLQIASTFLYLGIVITSNLLIDSLLPVAPLSLVSMLVIKAAVLILIIFLFCETMAKTYAAQQNIRFAKDFVWLVEFIYYIFKRVASWILISSNSIEKSILKKGARTFNNTDLDKVITQSKSDEVSSIEKRILKGVLNFSQIPVKQIMKSRLEIVGIKASWTMEEVIQKIQAIHYTKMPVYKNNLDEIIGFIYTKDLLPYMKQLQFDWHSLIQPPFYVHELKMIEELQKYFVKKQQSLAIVVDEFGGTSGLVTLDDIYYSVIGNLKGEHDKEEILFEKINNHTYIFRGKTKIIDVCKTMELPLNTFDAIKGESDTIAGLILEITSEIPVETQNIIMGDFKFTIVSIHKNRIERIKIAIEYQD